MDWLKVRMPLTQLEIQKKKAKFWKNNKFICFLKYFLTIKSKKNFLTIKSNTYTNYVNKWKIQ